MVAHGMLSRVFHEKASVLVEVYFYVLNISNLFSTKPTLELKGDKKIKLSHDDDGACAKDTNTSGSGSSKDTVKSQSRMHQARWNFVACNNSAFCLVQETLHQYMFCNLGHPGYSVLVEFPFLRFVPTWKRTLGRPSMPTSSGW